VDCISLCAYEIEEVCDVRHQLRDRIRAVTLVTLLCLSSIGVSLRPAFAQNTASIGTIIQIEKSVSEWPDGPFFDTVRVKPNSWVYFRVRVKSYSVVPIDAACKDEMCQWYENYRLTNGQAVDTVFPMFVENNTGSDQHAFNVATVSYRDPRTGRRIEAHDVAHVVSTPRDPEYEYGQILGGGEFKEEPGVYNNFAGDLAGFLGEKGSGQWQHLRKREKLPALLFELDTNEGDTCNVTYLEPYAMGIRQFYASGKARCWIEGKEKPVKVGWFIRVVDGGEDGKDNYQLSVTGPPGTNTTFTTYKSWKDATNPLTVRYD
jgi:hypothetical protein